ncbi:Ecdysone-induced protein 78C [Blattella germanica]|nr:Ecdysone-induced protein 78C [Blattella germanica]
MHFFIYIPSIFVGILPTEYPEADRVPVSAGRKVPRDPAEQESVSVLSFQEMPRRWHVSRLYVCMYAAVRYGRVPKRSRERSGEESASATRVSTSDAEQSDAETKQLAVYDVILTVSQAFHANCGYTEEQTRGLPAAAGGSSPEGPEVASSTAESLEQQRVWLWQQFATHVTPSVQRVANLLNFVNVFTGFCDLSQDDQLILIKVGFFEIWLGHVARLTSDSSLTFADGTYITRQQMELMYDPEFVSSLFHFASSLNALALNDTELGLFSAIVLLTADRPGVTDLKAIEHHQDRLIDALKVQVRISL